MSQLNFNGLDPHQRECTKLMRENCGTHRLHEVFRDFVEIGALAISNAIDKLHFEKREARYMDIIKRYSREEIDRFAKMLACITMSLECDFKDSLGQIFMNLELGDQWRGQFFTPYPVSYMMAKISASDINQAGIEAAGGFITMQEPTVGAGGMVIAFAQAMLDEKINYQRHLHVTATDVDATAAHMAYIQLSLLHIPALVIHGNSLSLVEWDHWATPAHVLGLWDRKLINRKEADDKEAPKPKECIKEAEVIEAESEVIPAVAMSEVRKKVVEQRISKANQLDLF